MENIYKWNNQKLDVINKMALLRNGNVPVPVVVLKGHKTNVEFVAKKESQILGSYFNVMKKMADFKSGVVNFVPSDIERGNVDWLDCNHEVIDVDALSIFDWNEFFAKLGLDGVSEDMFSDYTPDMKDALASIEDQVVMDVLYDHYERCDDNTITDQDIRIITGMVHDRLQLSSSQNLKSEMRANKQFKPQDNQERVAKSSELDKAKKEMRRNRQEVLQGTLKGDIAPLKDSVKDSRGKVTNDKENMSNEALIGSGDKVPVVEEKDVPHNEPAAEPVIEAAVETLNDGDSDAIIPKPKEQSKPKPNLVAKAELTAEEEAKNAELLEGLRTKYKDAIRYMNETCNAQYRIIVNSMQDAVDKDVYKQQYTKMYLNVSDDTGTELYRKLYDVDIATQQFHKDVVHQVKHIGCFNCGKNWDEDITFLSHGPHTVRCPHCYADYPFEK